MANQNAIIPYPNTLAFGPDIGEDLSAADAVWQDANLTNFSGCLWGREPSLAIADGLIEKNSGVGNHSWIWQVDSSTRQRTQFCFNNGVGCGAGVSCCNSGTSCANECHLTTNALTDNTPFFACFTYNGATPSLIMYVNGVAPAQTCPLAVPSTIANCTATFNVGRGGSGFVGFMDEITFWNGTLSAADILRLCCGSGTSCPSGCSVRDQRRQGVTSATLVGYWNIEGDTTAGGATDKAGGAGTLGCINCESDDFTTTLP
jgi:hypothetical protein